MQIAETLLILFAMANVIYFIAGKKASRAWGYTGLTLLLLHLFLGEIRWQVVLIYVVLIILLAVHFFGLSTRKWIRVTVSIFGFIFTVLSTTLAYALPVFSIYQPTGRFAVGSKQLYLKDETRPEDITEDNNDFRELMVEVYYPSNQAKGNASPYLKPVERKGFALKYGLPQGTFDYLNNVNTHVQPETEAALGSFPVLIFSPGYYTPASGYHSILTDLASHGFIIFSINHSYENMASRFPDGREIYFDQAYAAAHNWTDEMQQAVNDFDNANTQEARYQAIKVVSKVFEGGVFSVARWSDDISSVIDAIEKWNTDSSFSLAGKMKLDQLGTFGHSRGGAAAVEASIFDHRIKAAANLDGAQWGHVIDTTLHKPTTVFSSATTLTYDVNKYIFQESKGADFYDVVLANSGHSNFSDIPYMIRIPQLNEAGRIAPEEATASFNAFLLAFFKKHLLKEASDLNELVSGDENLSWK